MRRRLSPRPLSVPDSPLRLLPRSKRRRLALSARRPRRRLLPRLLPLRLPLRIASTRTGRLPLPLTRRMSRTAGMPTPTRRRRPRRRRLLSPPLPTARLRPRRTRMRTSLRRSPKRSLKRNPNLRTRRPPPGNRRRPGGRRRLLSVVRRPIRLPLRPALPTTFARPFAVFLVTSIPVRRSCSTRFVRPTSRKAKPVVSLSRLVPLTSPLRPSSRRRLLSTATASSSSRFPVSSSSIPPVTSLSPTCVRVVRRFATSPSWLSISCTVSSPRLSSP